MKYERPLEGRESFRKSLLERKTEEEWSMPFHHWSFLNVPFRLDDTTIKGKDLVMAYKERFPAGREYSLMGNAYRMIDECAIPRFSYSDAENIRSFILSAKDESDWAKTELTLADFHTTDFKHTGISLKGQMLGYKVFVDDKNAADGTYYLFIDYQKGNFGLAGVIQTHEFVKALFQRARIKSRYDEIRDLNITPEALRQILLSAKTEEGWRTWLGTADEFKSLRFNFETARTFSGALLCEVYGAQSGRTLNLEEIFSDAKVAREKRSVLLEEARRPEIYQEFYKVFEDPFLLRNIILSVYNQDDWNKPKLLTELRKMKAVIGDREVCIHTFLHWYAAYRELAKEGSVEERATQWGKVVQEIGDHKAKVGRVQLEELLDQAGIKHEHTFPKDITDLDLTDPDVLRRLLLNGEYEGEQYGGRVLDTNKNFVQFRKARFKDPESEVEVCGHTLMCYYTGQKYVKEHPEVSVREATFKLKKARSNIEIWRELLTVAGLI